MALHDRGTSGWDSARAAHHQEEDWSEFNNVVFREGDIVLCLEVDTMMVPGERGKKVPHYAYKFLLPDCKVIWTLNFSHLMGCFKEYPLNKR